MIKRNSIGQFMKQKNIIGYFITVVALISAAYWLADYKHPAAAQELPEGCVHVGKDLECDFTSEETKANLGNYVIYHEIPDMVISKSTDPETMAALIKQISWEEGLNESQTQLALDIANCESRLNPFATNGAGNSPAGSVDRGLFQFSSHWQKRVSDSCAFDAHCATREAVKMIKQGQASLWSCTKKIR